VVSAVSSVVPLSKGYKKRAVVEAVNAISEHGFLEYASGVFAGSVSAEERVLGRLKISVTVKPAEDDPQKWEVVFKLPFEYNAAIAYIASGISRLKRSIENRITALAGDFNTRFERIEAALEDLDKRLARLEEKHKRILKGEEEEEEEDYEEDDW